MDDQNLDNSTPTISVVQSDGELRQTHMEDQAVPTKPQTIGPPQQKVAFKTITDLGFRFGLAFLLLTNGIVAFIEPESFSSLLEANAIGGLLPSGLIDVMVMFAGVNDITLSILVISGKWKSIVYLWIGLWFAVIAGVKAMNLIF